VIIKINGEVYDSQEWDIFIAMSQDEKQSMIQGELHCTKVAWIVGDGKDAREDAFDEMDSIGWWPRDCDMCGRRYMYIGNPLCVRCSRGHEDTVTSKKEEGEDVS